MHATQQPITTPSNTGDDGETYKASLQRGTTTKNILWQEHEGKHGDVAGCDTG